MADVSQVNLDGGYVPVSETRKKNPIALGWYPCHITDCQVKTTKIKGKYKAKIYNPILEVADEVKGLKFTVKDIKNNDMEVTGEDYVGYTFRSMGVFYFLNPQVGDDFEVYPKGNVGYMYFCQALGLDLPKVKMDVDGTETEVFKLPELSKDDILGKHLMACIGNSKPWVGRDGLNRTSFEAKAFKVWEGAKTKTVLEDLPF